MFKITMFSRWGLLGVLFLVFVSTTPLQALAALPAGFEVETLASGMTLPTGMTFTNDGRVFIAEKGGIVRVWKNGALLPTPLIQLTDVNTYGDRGLLGIVTDPNFSSNGYLYLLYTYENTPGSNFAGPKTGRLVRVQVQGDTADESTKVVILGKVGGNLSTPSCENYAVTDDCIPSDSPSHSVGGLRFGPDGKLYVSLGDGSHFDYVDPRAMRSQNIDSLGGKVLRINTDGSAPTDNPFYNGSSSANRSKVYAYGFRNAYRFNFRPSNNALYAGDVGWSTWEEVNKVTAGGNYGWPCREGNATTTGYNCNVSPHVNPVYAYAHDVNGAGSIAAGAFATAYPAAYTSSFFIGDYAQNWIKRVTVNASDQFVSVQDFYTGDDGANGPVAIDRGPDGNIYYLAIYTGELKRFLYTAGNRQPVAVLKATPTNGLAPLTVNFSAASSTDPDGNPLTYSWSFGDGGTSTSTNPTHVYGSNGSYNAVLTVFDGQGGQNTKSVTITVGNRAPTAVITAPANGSLYQNGATINLAGYGTDPENGTITAVGQLTWTIILHHNIHTHTIQTLSGPNPSFPAPDHGSATDVYTEVQLTVTDSGGLTNTKSINLYLNNNVGGSGNLIQNPSFENAVPAAPDTPEFWLRGGYGINNSIYTYPVIGFDGAKGAKVAITSYTDGDAKWFHNPVSVSPNTPYVFSGYYKSNVPADVIVQFGYGTGTYTYENLGSPVPASTNWNRIDRSLTTPAGAQTVVVAVLLNRVGEITVDHFSLTQGTSTPPGDTTAPTVSVSAPGVASGTVTLSATAADNVGVTEVKFLVDSILVGTDTTAPYSFAWNSASVSNGNHAVTAAARDAAGNNTTSTPVNTQVSNTTTTPGGTNLIQNPSVETASTTPNTPLSWFTNKWGTNTATFTYPVTGFDGTKAVRVNVTSYTSGDAKWFFQDVPVTPGTQYAFSNYYQSTATSSLVARYKRADGTFLYLDIATNISPSASWKQLNYTFTPPAGIVSMTVFHILARTGTLTTDLFSISIPGATDTTPPTTALTFPTNGQVVSGTITVSGTATDPSGVGGVRLFLDNVQNGSEDTTTPYQFSLNTTSLTNGSHTLALVSRDTLGNTTTTPSITVNVQNTVSTSTPQNLIVNGSFETANGADPLGWKRGGWGTNTILYGYPVLGRDGNKAAQINVTAYTDGDAKWFPNDVVMENGKVYTFSTWYKSNTISDVIGRYTLTDGSYHYFGVVKEIPPAADWTFVSATFTPPISATAFTPMHLISAIGTLATDDVSLTVSGNGTSTNDITPPVAQITFPLPNATVSGTITVVASSSDNIAVTGVFFAVNGNPTTPLITTPPYTFVWDTTTVPNGTHVLKATTHDAAGNNSAVTSTVIVNNATTTPPNPNLIDNPSLETANGADPLGWLRGGWGTNTATHTYPVTGSEGAKGARVSISSYTNGDAKWYFTPKAVTPGASYTYSNYYQSNVTSTMTIQYTMTGGGFTYIQLSVLPASASWVKHEKVITIPANVTAMTVFHHLNTVGQLSTDQYSLVRN